jgi:hypothetical protein
MNYVRNTPIRASAVTLFAFAVISLEAPAQKAYYLEEIKRATEQGWKDNPAIVDRWKAGIKSNLLWGYDPPAHPVYLASTLAFLYEETRDLEYARRAASLLESYGDLRKALPNDFAGTRAEYSQGIPPLSNFFFLPPYVRAYLRIRSSNVLDAPTKTKIERDIAESVDFIFRFPEWGAHNRAMLRAEALQYALLAMPGHPRASTWKQLSEAIAADNLNHWEVEDASGYHPVYLHALFSYAEAAGRGDIYSEPILHYYLRYYQKLISPTGSIPDFGDAAWNGAAAGLRFVAVFEKGAAVFKDPQLKWAARSMLKTIKDRAQILSVGDAYHLADAYRWTDESVTPVPPSTGSEEVLEDVIGKKVVFRNGWDSSSTYLLLNYRDEGEGGWLDREYLRRTISVEEEKMHHGHADENSVVLLMDRGAVLLHDGGYRDALPSGKFGAWRQDYFHNRLVVRKNKRDANQPVLEFVRNSGAYRQVKSQKVDFLTLRNVDMSRTRVLDNTLGYQWDRTVVYVRDPGYFVVIDGVRVLTPDYYTFVNMWHTQEIVRRGDHFFDVANDSIRGFVFPRTRSLLIAFPESYQKSEGVEPISRQFQMEQAIYQTVSSQYKAGDTECFITILYPHDPAADPARLAAQFHLLATSAPYRAIALESSVGGKISTLMTKLDLDMELARENIRPRYQFDLGKVSFGDFSSDAYFLYAMQEGTSLQYSAANFLKVIYRGKTLVEALPNTHPLQLDGGSERVGFSKWRRWEDSITFTGSDR